MKKSVLATSVATGLALGLHAAVSLPHVFGDNMVLQRGMRVPVWTKGGSITSVLDMAETLRPLMGRFAVVLFMCGTLAAGLSSVFPIMMVAPLLVGDWRDGRMRTDTPVFRMICLAAAAWGLVVPAVGSNPVSVTILAQTSNVFVLPLTVGIVLWLVNRRDVMGRFRAGPILNVVLAAAFAFSAVIAYVGAKTLMSRF